MDWSTRRVVDLMEMILMSAGTLSPTSVHTKERHREIEKTIKLSPITLNNWFIYHCCRLCRGQTVQTASLTCINLTTALQQDGWREEWVGLQGWLTGFSTLDGSCCCWKLIPQSETEGEGDLWEITKWNEQVYSKQRERQRSESACRY